MSIFRSRHILFSMVFGGVRVADLFRFLCCPILCPYFPSSVPWCPLWFPHKNDVQLFFFYLKLIVGGLRSYLRYLCLLAYSDVQHILCCVFDLFVFVLCNLCCQLFWIVPSVFSNIHLLTGLTLTYDVTVHWHMMWLSTDIWCDCPLTWCDCPLTYDVTVHWHDVTVHWLMMWLSKASTWISIGIYRDIVLFNSLMIVLLKLWNCPPSLLALSFHKTKTRQLSR